jgi:diguanylate cyclase (GGDEF)-like protein/PAS domain S-box-containing protein
MLVALREGREMVTKDFYVDQWGTYMSAYVPIYTSAGEMIGILGVDMTLEEYFQRLAVMRRVLFFTIGISLLLSVAMGLVVFAARRVVKNYEVQLEQDRIIIENSKTMLFRWRTDSGWPMELVSDNVRQFGYKAEDLLSRMVTYASIIHPDDLDRVITEVKHYEDSGAESFEQDYRIICADSSVRWVYERTIVERDKNGRAHHFQGVVIDITERKNNEARMQQLLRDEVAVWDVLFSQSSDGIVVLDQDGSVYQMNKRYADMLGYSMEEAHQLHVWDWDCQFSKEEIIEMLRTADESGVHFETKQRRKDGTLIDVELSNNSAVYKGKKLAFCIVRDISERKRVEEQIRRFATTDSLTGIANRREFTRIVESEIDRVKRYGTPLSLIMYDLDHFKRVNDTFGHDVGDDVLQTVSRLVKENIRSVDVTGRWGGEEFMVLLPQTDLDSANKVAEKLRQAIELHRFNKVGQVTASFGLTQFVPEDDIELLTKRVDEALYQAKKRGRNCVEILVGGERKSDK